MSNYKNPKCDCETFLYGRRNEIWIVGRAITKDGLLSNRIIGLQTNFDDADWEFTLHCPKCGNEYNVDYDESDRIIRGELIQ